MSKTRRTSKGRNGGKQKAWRLGAILGNVAGGVPAAAGGAKAMLGIFGDALRQNPGLLRHIHRRQALVASKRGGCGYTMNEDDTNRSSFGGNPQLHRGKSRGWNAMFKPDDEETARWAAGNTWAVDLEKALHA